MTSLKNNKTLNIEDLKQITQALSNSDKELEKVGELITDARTQMLKTFWNLFELRVQMIKKINSVK